MRVQRPEPRPAVCVSKAARGDGCERFVNSEKQSAALMFTRVTWAAAGRAHTHSQLHAYTHTGTFTVHTHKLFTLGC